MPDQINTAIMLLIVGIITVFAILSLIVLLGSLLIRIVNRFYPQLPQLSTFEPHQEVKPNEIAAIVAAVETITGGKGKVEHISKMNKQNKS
ncbi:MAG TPA: oxaloacetate decarboxylase [Cytophagales bacterium]|jgi:oxaloacetate decarboxylase gamma subunit|nr:oxaloacetate decarboxylase [Cytophagales bacterium]